MMISYNENPTLNNKCTLIAISTIENDIGETAKLETPTILWCAEFSVMSNEFYNASQSGIKVQKVLCVHSNEYKGQTLLEYQGTKYSIYRVYLRSDRKTELYCSERVGNG